MHARQSKVLYVDISAPSYTLQSQQLVRRWTAIREWRGEPGAKIRVLYVKRPLPAVTKTITAPTLSRGQTKSTKIISHVPLKI